LLKSILALYLRDEKADSARLLGPKDCVDGSVLLRLET